MRLLDITVPCFYRPADILLSKKRGAHSIEKQWYTGIDSYDSTIIIITDNPFFKTMSQYVLFFLFQFGLQQLSFLLLLDDVALRNVDTVQELTDILVLDSGDLLNAGSRLWDSIEIVASNDQLILLGSGSLTGDTLQHLDAESNLLSQEVTDLNFLTVVVNDNVDGKMGIYVTHLVFKTLGNTSDHVVDNGTDGTDAGDVLTVAVVDDKLELLLTDRLDLHVKMAKVLGELTTGTLDGHNARLDVDFNVIGNDELVVLVDVL
jgi:hypothetical protein